MNFVPRTLCHVQPWHNVLMMCKSWHNVLQLPWSPGKPLESAEQVTFVQHDMSWQGTHQLDSICDETKVTQHVQASRAVSKGFCYS